MTALPSKLVKMKDRYSIRLKSDELLEPEFRLEETERDSANSDDVFVLTPKRASSQTWEILFQF